MIRNNNHKKNVHPKKWAVNTNIINERGVVLGNAYQAIGKTQ